MFSLLRSYFDGSLAGNHPVTTWFFLPLGVGPFLSHTPKRRRKKNKKKKGKEGDKAEVEEVGESLKKKAMTDTILLADDDLS